MAGLWGCLADSCGSGEEWVDSRCAEVTWMGLKEIPSPRVRVQTRAGLKLLTGKALGKHFPLDLDK